MVVVVVVVMALSPVGGWVSWKGSGKQADQVLDALGERQPFALNVHEARIAPEACGSGHAMVLRTDERHAPAAQVMAVREIEAGFITRSDGADMREGRECHGRGLSVHGSLIPASSERIAGNGRREARDIGKGRNGHEEGH